MLSLDERRRWFLPAIAEYLGLTLSSFRTWLKLPAARDLPRRYGRTSPNPRRCRFFYTAEVVDIEARIRGVNAWQAGARRRDGTAKGAHQGPQGR